MPEPVLATDPEKGEKSFRFPYFLPGEKTPLYTIGLSSMDTYDEAKNAALSLDIGTSKIFIDAGSNAKYAPSGHLVFTRIGQIMGAPFVVEAL